MSTSSSSAESPHSSFAATTSISASAPGDPQRAVSRAHVARGICTRCLRRCLRTTFDALAQRPKLSDATPPSCAVSTRSHSLNRSGQEPDAPHMHPQALQDLSIRKARRRSNVVPLQALPASGASRDRTGDLLLAKQALSQLSYGPRERPSLAGALTAASRLVPLEPPATPRLPLSIRTESLGRRIPAPETSQTVPTVRTSTI